MYNFLHCASYTVIEYLVRIFQVMTVAFLFDLPALPNNDDDYQIALFASAHV